MKSSTSSFALLHVLQHSMNMPYLIMPDGVTKLSFSALYSSDLTTLISRITDELMAPLRRMNIEQAEFVTLKALLLLQPDLSGLTVMSRDRIRESRDSFMRALFGYLCSRNNPIDASVRQSSLLMLIPALTSIGHAIADNPTLCSLFGLNEPSATGTPTISSPPANPTPAIQNPAELLKNMIGNYKDGGIGGELLSREMLLAAQLLAQHQSLNGLNTGASTTTASSSPPLSAMDGLPSAFGSITPVRLTLLSERLIILFSAVCLRFATIPGQGFHVIKFTKSLLFILHVNNCSTNILTNLCNFPLPP